MGGLAYRDLEINHLLSKRGHLIVEAESVLADALGREDKVALALLGAVKDGLLTGSDNGVVHIKRTARLDLHENTH
jgi:hypothetical protein